MGTEVTTFYSQKGIPVEGRQHQPTLKTFDTKISLPIRCAGIKMEQRLKERPNYTGPA